MCIPSLITLNFYGMVFKLVFFLFNGNFGLPKWHASQAPLQTVPPPPPSIASTKQYSQPDFNICNLF